MDLKLIRAARMQTKADAAIGMCASLLGSIEHAQSEADSEAERDLFRRLHIETTGAMEKLRAVEERTAPYKLPMSEEIT